MGKVEVMELTEVELTTMELFSSLKGVVELMQGLAVKLLQTLPSQVPTDYAKASGTYAYAVQTGENADCQAAVNSWKAAFPGFEGVLPPAYDANIAPYNNTQSISFISLFNPKDDPKVDCAYFTCPTPTKNAESTPSENETTANKGVNALICITTPSALESGQRPYTQDQWNQISDGLKRSSAATAVPTALSLAAVALVALLL
ncbi:SAG family member [Eimeria praecox]|uniref:SAG family member n=1 Tax=Eimeria praecox TaxID=51316 RepID=U6G3T7_9EIME|nr:SAG family member [Eimeria praecox]